MKVLMPNWKGRWVPRASGWKLRAAGGALAGLAAGSLGQLRAQSFFNPYAAPLPAYGSTLNSGEGAGDNFLINRGVPYSPVGAAPMHDYNMKFGPVTASVGGSVSTSYYDNYNLVPEGSGLKQEDELSINPSLAIPPSISTSASATRSSSTIPNLTASPSVPPRPGTTSSRSGMCG